jgi:cyclic pyranopterin phosphate synthase
MSYSSPTKKLIDSFGREVNYVRLSVTDRCDFRCVYCMSEDMTFLPRREVLTLEELHEVAKVFVSLGVKKIRVTGGEPLVRRNVLSLFQNLGRLSGLEDLSLTTNGSQLATYAQNLVDAGVRRVNVSLDTLDTERFSRLTRHGKLAEVLKGIKAARKAGFERIKLNAVILQNHNADEVQALTQFALDQGLDISFIEEMPLGDISSHAREAEFISSDELRRRLQEHLQLIPSTATSGGPSRYWQVPGYASRIGFISPHSHNFCASCNRVRVTAAGRLLLCLGNEHSVDLRQILRDCPGDSAKLEHAIVQSMAIKPERHHFNLQDEPQIVRFMNTTGG